MMARNLKWLGSVTAAALPLLAGYAQTPSPAESPTPAAPPTATPAGPKPGDAAPATQPGFAPNVAEVVKLAKSSVGDEVVIAFIKNCQSPYRLSAGDILALKDAGLSSPVVAAMLSHDTALPPVHEALASTLPGTPGTSAPYTYHQKLYGPPADAQAGPANAPSPAPGAQPPLPTQPMLPAQPVPTAQPVPPAQPFPPQQVAAPAPVMVQQPPPPPQVEVVGASPGIDFYWAPGYWAWRGGGWVWIGGCWAHRPYPGAVWIGGRWGWRGRGYVWIGGRWR